MRDKKRGIENDIYEILKSIFPCQVCKFEQYPNHKKAYINSMQKALDKYPSKHFVKDAGLAFEWWTSNKSIANFLKEREG